MKSKPVGKKERSFDCHCISNDSKKRDDKVFSWTKGHDGVCWRQLAKGRCALHREGRSEFLRSAEHFLFDFLKYDVANGDVTLLDSLRIVGGHDDRQVNNVLGFPAILA